ncbi:MAG: sugar phosphate isomerase/epimerase family protein [Bdellovibrionales bacterium]
MKRDVYLSTGGFSGEPASSVVEALLDHGLTHFELSGGVWREDLLGELKKLSQKASLRLHNYFPPPAVPFVFNLASPNPEVQKLSQGMLQQAIEWSAELGSEFYGFHAGFLTDPSAQELGRKFNSRPLFDREEAIHRFVDVTGQWAEKAKIYGVKLLIENNVLSPFNYKEFGQNILLMVTPEECRDVLKQLPGVGLLLDVAHLKVSAQTLGFSAESLFPICGELIQGYHLSDNNGLADSNDAFTMDSWFWKHMNRKLQYYSLEVYSKDPEILMRQVELCQKQLQAF